MDLNDIIGLVNATPEPERPEPSKNKADALYDDVVKFLERERCVVKDHVEDGCLRASQLYKALQSLPALRAATSPRIFTDLGEPLTASHAANFDAGHMIHEWWRQEYLGPMGRLWGQWACLRCDRVVVTGTMPERCPSCGFGRSALKFVEKLLTDRALRLRGHPDGLLLEHREATDPALLLEIKSAKSDRWDKLAQPETDHIVQAHAYMKMLDVREAIFVYVDKGKQAEWRVVGGSIKPVSPPRWKMFHTEFDTATWANIEAGLKEYWSIRDRLMGSSS